jgi:hypothetical protein
MKHLMTFVFQVRGRDLEDPRLRRSLVSFHYCQECVFAGHMSHGWMHDTSNGYDVSVFDIDESEPDSLGIVAPPIAPPSHGVERQRAEVPLPEDAGIEWEQLPADYPTLADDFDERLYHRATHIRCSKVGGWPTWVQSPDWPRGGRWLFIGQLDSRISDDVTWVAGGYAYLFVRRDRARRWVGELAIQTT